MDGDRHAEGFRQFRNFAADVAVADHTHPFAFQLFGGIVAQVLAGVEVTLDDAVMHFGNVEVRHHLEKGFHHHLRGRPAVETRCIHQRSRSTGAVAAAPARAGHVAGAGADAYTAFRERGTFREECRRSDHRIILISAARCGQFLVRAEVRNIEKMLTGRKVRPVPTSRSEGSAPGFNVGPDLGRIGLAVGAGLQAHQVRDQNAIGTIRIVLARGGFSSCLDFECRACLGQDFFQNNDLGAVVGIGDVFKQGDDIICIADTSDPGPVIARGSGKGIHVARGIQPGLVPTVRMGQAFISKKLLGPQDDAVVNVGIGDAGVIDPEQCNSGAAFFGIVDTWLQQVLTSEPVVDALSVCSRAPVHDGDRSEHVFNAQQTVCGLGECQGGKRVDHTAGHLVGVRIVERSKSDGLVTGQRFFRIFGHD